MREQIDWLIQDGIGMILFVNGVKDGIQCNYVSFWTSDYESAFELLTELVADHWILQEATLVDGTDRMVVPIDAFDGQPMQVHIRKLQQQWQMILFGQPSIPDTLSKKKLKNWYMQLDAYYDDMLIHLGKMISILEMRKKLLISHPNEPLRTHLERQYDSLLISNRRMFRQTKMNQKKNKVRLNKYDED